MSFLVCDDFVIFVHLALDNYFSLWGRRSIAGFQPEIWRAFEFILYFISGVFLVGVPPPLGGFHLPRGWGQKLEKRGLYCKNGFIVIGEGGGWNWVSPLPQLISTQKQYFNSNLTSNSERTSEMKNLEWNLQRNEIFGTYWSHVGSKFTMSEMQIFFSKVPPNGI